MRAVIFDMDGVLVDSEPQHYKALNQMLAQTQGFTLTFAEYAGFVGMTNDSMWEILERTHEMQLSRAERQARFVQARDALDAADGFIPVPGAIALVQALAARGAMLAVASSSPAALIEETVDAFGLRDCFAQLVSGCDVARPKPAPDVFLKAARLLGREATDCLVIEDSAAGVQAARAAGMACVGLRNPNSGAQDLSVSQLQLDGFDAFTLETIAPLLGL